MCQCADDCLHAIRPQSYDVNDSDKNAEKFSCHKYQYYKIDLLCWVNDTDVLENLLKWTSGI